MDYTGCGHNIAIYTVNVLTVLVLDIHMCIHN